MKKIFIKLLIALCLLVVLIPLSIIEYVSLVEDGVIMSSDNREFQEKLKQKLESGAEEIKLKDLTNFEWDEACIYIDIDYKISKVNESSESWFLTFSLSTEIVREFNIKKTIVKLKTPIFLDDFYCYSETRVLQIEEKNGNYLILLKK